ncbi:thymidine phosphorylase-like [Daphnia pulicaria]|uniref:thymidine phosphorylase-like n=1 Tax=Daphnia pulicaria TaxID=35523 RepID=UPI001EEAD7F4|nr:thymidine phosphorylase-like [Daphnia pulicaria]
MERQSIRIPDVIQKKRDKYELEPEEIKFFIDEMVKGCIEPVQLGAMLMAWYFNGMSPKELTILIDCMTHSGETLSWPEEWKTLLVDKHSTGGVGDKVSLVLAPALAACGLKVPMVSGRGLSFTGGTLDKLEAIPGFNVSLTNEQMRECLKHAGCFIAGQTESLVPADRIMYAARDVTATVDNINLATASIISKKAAENISALVLDVKVGRAAFFKNLNDARLVAKSLVEAARDQGINTTAVLTTMDVPIGMAIGNSLEVMEVIETLRGKGPADLVELVKIQGGLLLNSVGRTDVSKGQQLIEETLHNGAALACFEKMLVHQNVDVRLAADLCSGGYQLTRAKYVTAIHSPLSGRVLDIDALACGSVCGALGAARARASDEILSAVGIELLVTVGQSITQGQPWANLHHEEQSVASDLLVKLQNAVVVGNAPHATLAPTTRILEIVQ